MAAINIQTLKRLFHGTQNVAPEIAHVMALAYAPIIRSFLLPCAAYYAYVTWGHWQDEVGLQRLTLAGLSVSTIIYCLAARHWLKVVEKVSFGGLELIGLLANLLIFANVALYMQLSFVEEKLIYFILISIVFSTSGITFRSGLFSVGLAIGTMLWFAAGVSAGTLAQYISIGVAASVVAIGMSYLLRKAMKRQVRARMEADQLAVEATFQANTDMLTGLPGRRAAFAEIRRQIALGQPFWLGLIDLDGFKAVNDAYGHALGDNLLKQVANRLRNASGSQSHISRLGGDEFAWVLSGSLDETQLQELSADLNMSLANPYYLDGKRVVIGSTIGFCHFPTMATSAEEVYERADFALYAAKESHRGGMLVFRQKHNREMAQSSALDRALREANLDTEFYLHFQPQYSLSESRVVGFEALARWTSPELGSVPPDIFIPAAERSGFTRNLTIALFRKAVDAASTWPDHIGLSFNLSAQDLIDSDLCRTLLDVIDAVGLSHSRVEFEITETSVMRDVVESRRFLARLKSAGCKIALDDFGKGYSSFEQLQALALDKIKIDRSFVSRVRSDILSRELVAAMVGLCNAVHLQCVLEGVETDEELEYLRVLKADLIQGYVIGRPTPVENLYQFYSVAVEDSEDLLRPRKSG